ncbi:hypothetical protein LguiA_010235 [Lonicera macranthoides]
MEGRRRVYDEMGEIKKGPWKAEEDEVLINHVKKYGPRDWSSIRSKGLLQRTGKSCRLRWVNKLHPNLKNGVKFSAEEERIVIELQAQFGNKWARIATYLPGRTDNDVKNFWSSRQKRLARILQTPAAPSTTKSHKYNNGEVVPSLHDIPALEAPKFSYSIEEESSFKAQPCSSSTYIDNPEPIRKVPLPELLNPNLVAFEQNLLQLDFIPIEKKPYIDHSPPPHSTFPQLEPELPLGLESQELETRVGDPYFLNVFGQAESSDIIQLPYVSPCFGAERRYVNGGSGENEKPVTPDTFIDDFPMDIFDQIETLPSPLDW